MWGANPSEAIPCIYIQASEVMQNHFYNLKTHPTTTLYLYLFINESVWPQLFNKPYIISQFLYIVDIIQNFHSQQCTFGFSLSTGCIYNASSSELAFSSNNC